MGTMFRLFCVNILQTQLLPPAIAKIHINVITNACHPICGPSSPPGHILSARIIGASRANCSSVIVHRPNWVQRPVKRLAKATANTAAVRPPERAALLHAIHLGHWRIRMRGTNATQKSEQLCWHMPGAAGMFGMYCGALSYLIPLLLKFLILSLRDHFAITWPFTIVTMTTKIVFILHGIAIMCTQSCFKRHSGIGM